MQNEAESALHERKNTTMRLHEDVILLMGIQRTQIRNYLQSFEVPLNCDQKEKNKRLTDIVISPH